MNKVLQREAYVLLGLPFDVVTLNESAKILAHCIEEEERCFLSTPNLNFVISARSDPDFFDSVLQSDLVIADGMPIVWIAKLLGIPIRERVAGSSLFNQLSQQKMLDRKIKVFFFGGQQGVAETAHRVLNETSVGMESCGYYDPGFVGVDEMSTSAIRNLINQANPDFLVVALGAKKGQEWIQENKAFIDASVISHLGAVINFVAGTVERAPVRWQKLGLEWLWRIRQEPGLWKRYFFDGFEFISMIVLRVLPLVIVDKLVFGRGDSSLDIAMSEIGSNTVELEAKGTICIDTMSTFRDVCVSVFEQSDNNVVINCTNLEYIDSAGIASLLLFQSDLCARGRTLVLSDLPWKVGLLFKLNQVWDRFTIPS